MIRALILACLIGLCGGQALAVAPPYPAATVPLTGAEIFVCWQGGVTKNCMAGQGGPLIIPATNGPVNLYVANTGSDTNGVGGPNYCFSSLAPCQHIAYAAKVAYLTSAATGISGLGGGYNSIYVNLAAGAYTECVFVNGQIPGGADVTPVGSSNQGAPALAFIGAGSGVTTWHGCSSYAGTLIVSNYANADLSALTIDSTGANPQSSLFVQLTGTVNIRADVKIGSASGAEQVHVENQGSVQIWNSLTMQGTANNAFGCGNNGLFTLSAGVLTINGTYSLGVLSENGGGCNFQQNTGTTFAGSASGRNFLLSATASLTLQSSGLTLPGSTAGWLQSGARISGPSGANYDEPAVAAHTGIGSTGTASSDSGSGAYAGSFTITPGGSGIAAGGTVTLTFPFLLLDNNTNPARCSFSPGGTSWSASGTGISSFYLVTALSSAGVVGVGWTNNTALTSGTPYVVDYTCQN